MSCVAAVVGTVPDTIPVSDDHSRPEGSPVTVTVTVSPSASLTAMPNASIVCPGAYALFPGFTIVGSTFPTVIVIVNVEVTALLAPSFAVTVTG